MLKISQLFLINPTVDKYNCFRYDFLIYRKINFIKTLFEQENLLYLAEKCESILSAKLDRLFLKDLSQIIENKSNHKKTLTD